MSKFKKDTLVNKIHNDIDTINLMMRYLVKDYRSIEGLNEISETYKKYVIDRTNDSIFIKDELCTNIYNEIKIVLDNLLENYNDKLINRVDSLRIKYSKIGLDDKKTYRTLSKVLKRLKKEYKINIPVINREIQISLELKRTIDEYLKVNDTADIVYIGFDVLNMVNKTANELYKLNNINPIEIESVKIDPISFISQKDDEYIKKYQGLKDSLNILKKETDLLQDYQNTISELNDSIERENDKFSRQNETLIAVREVAKNELLASTNKQIQLNEELTRIRSKLSRYEQQVIEKANERNELSEDTDTLSAMLESALNDFASAQNDIINLKAISEKLEADTTALQARKTEIETKSKELEAQKAQAENGRLIFLISSIVLLLGMLCYVSYVQWQVRQENKTLLEEKVLLEKNIEYTEGFFEEYRKISKAEIAIQREKLKKQNVVMLRELNHRTKNNLQMISSILGIQAMSIDDKKAKEVLINSKSRIHAIGLIHKGMYKEAFDDQVHVMMKNYVNNLVNSLKKSFQFEAEVTINNEVENIFIRPDKALPIGLIINEVVTNAFKHAFSGQPNPTLDIILKHKGENELCVSIKDNGNGMNNDQTTKKSFGLKMIDLLIHELEGKYMFENDNGLKFSMTFPVQYTLKNGT